MTRGELFLISAPSGAGKNSLMDALGAHLGHERLAFVVSHTTRPPRAGERDGVDYHFVDDARFEEMVRADRFLEWARVYDHRYGTAAAEVLPRLAQGIDVVHDLDVQGAARLRGLDRLQMIMGSLSRPAGQPVDAQLRLVLLIVQHARAPR